MSWLSSVIRSPIVQAIAKPLVKTVPFVGGAISDRILMSPTPAQANAVEATESSVQRVAATLPAIQAEQSKPAPTAVALGSPVSMFHSADGKLSTQGMVLIGGGLLVVIAILFALRSHK